MTGIDLALAAVLDVAVGDPRWFPHPVRGMGAVIGWIDHRIRTICRSEQTLQIAGVCLALGLPAAVYGAAAWVIAEAVAVHPILGQAVGIGLASTTLAGRDLYDHVQAVTGALAAGDLAGARKAVAMIVGRDSAALTEPEIARATVETLAESASDGIIAPLVYLSLGGAPLALAYKAVNTLDSMIGHRDERYEHFGWASARLDDVLNWVPARLTGGFIALAAGLSTGQWHRIHESWYIQHRDGGKHPSPNSGQPEAAMAGALGVQLGGRNYYDGVPHDAERLGDGAAEVAPEHIGLATRLMLVTYALGLFFALLSLWVS
ncbi:MAG: adenosylcobinamide-phosphate synthase CbiB [Nitrospira sp.]|nr:cobalamin biosynthesis protein CobD [Nitrospira sp.]MCW5787357.1 cobalamin biosynthesis protein CobD [Nitrospira sp.]MDR4476919.1 adenosylcobinamide-phosphate synthase CbiB [Nitrospira sp.]